MSRLLSFARFFLPAVLLLAGCAKDAIEEIGPGPDGKQGVPEVVEDEGAFRFRVVIDGKEYPPMDATGDQLTVFVPDGTDLKHIVATFNDKDWSATVNDEPQVSGVTVNDFSNYHKRTIYMASSNQGETIKYYVRVLNTHLPAVAVTTATPENIKSREIWREATMRIRTADGSFIWIGGTDIRGRGNWTWEKYSKKPYALKLNQKQELFGMPAHKRWVLLAQYRGFIGNPLAFEASRRAPTIDWAPRGQFVEFVLNGKYQGLYYLCEQIKIDKNRVNISKLKEKDNKYPEVSGGYLLEYDELYDEDYKFKSEGFVLPVQVKEPNDTVTTAQFDYIRGFINDMEKEIKKIGTGEESHYADYLDMENFAEYWMVLETVGNYEAYKPRSVKFYKGRDGVDSPKGTVCKLKAGPLWDQELFEVNHKFNSKNMYYYRYLFKDPAFVACVKERWATYKSNLLGNSQYKSFIEYMNEFVAEIEDSAKRDLSLWANGYFTLEEEVATVREGFESKIEWMDAQIRAL